MGLSEKPRGGVHLHVRLGFANIQSPLLERMTGSEERYWMPESVRVSQFQKESTILWHNQLLSIYGRFCFSSSL